MLKLGKKDRLLLHQLMQNARQSISQAARAIGVSKEVCLYRLRRLEQEKLITGYYPIIDLSGLGYYNLRLQLKFGSIQKKDYDAFLQFLQQQRIVSWIYELAGHWDIVILVSVKQLRDYEVFHDLLVDQYGHLFQEKLMTIATKIHHFSRDMVTEMASRKPVITGKETKGDLGNIDFEILSILLQDARIPLHEIALKTTTPVNTVKYRVKRMETIGVIKGYRPHLDVSLIGLEYFKVQASLLNPQQRKLAIERLTQNKHTIYITESIGPFDVEFEADYAQITELVHFLDDLSKTIPLKTYDIVFDNKAIKINDIPL